MTKRDWTNIKREYVETDVTLADIEAKWDVKRGTLSARAARENWRDQKQQFAAKLEAALQEKKISQRAAEQARFEDAVMVVARAQVHAIAKQLQADSNDPSKVLKLANALEKLQRIGRTTFSSPFGAKVGEGTS